MRERYDIVIRDARAEAANQARDFLQIRAKVHEEIVAKLDRLLERGK